MKNSLLLCILFLFIQSDAIAGIEFQSRQQSKHTQAEQAMSEGNFAIAYCLWAPLAESGDSKAQFNIGWMNHNGYGLTIDDGKALNWWLKAAEKGYVDAFYTLADLYLAGFGVDKSKDIAMGWYIAAAEQGHEASLEVIHALPYRTDKFSKKYFYELILTDWYLKLALNGDEKSLDIIRSLTLRKDKKIKAYFLQTMKANWSLFGHPIQVRVSKANVRKGPGTSYEIVTSLKQGDKLIAISKKGNWTQAGYPDTGEIVWVFSKLIENIEKAPEE